MIIIIFALGIAVVTPQPDVRKCEAYERIARPMGKRPNSKNPQNEIRIEDFLYKLYLRITCLNTFFF